MAESVGFSGLSDEAARELAEDATFRIKTLIQDAHNFMVHARRKELLCEDVDHALKSEGEPKINWNCDSASTKVFGLLKAKLL